MVKKLCLLTHIFVFMLVFGAQAGATLVHPDLSVFSDTNLNLVPDDGQVAAYIKLSSWEAEKRDYLIQASLRGWHGELLESNEIPVNYEGGNAVTKWNLETSHYGPQTIEAKLFDKATGKEVASQELTLIRLVEPIELTEQQRMASSIGLNAHANANWDLFQRLGVHWVRDYSFGWLGKGAKPPIARNGLDFNKTVQQARNANVIVLPSLEHAFRLEDETDFIPLKEVKAGFKALADAFPELPYWEVENEFDIQLRKVDADSPERWGKYIEAAYEGVAQSKSKAHLLMNGRAGIHLDFTRELLESKYADYFTVVNYHYYTGTVPPEVSSSNMNNGVDSGYEDFSYLDQLRLVNALAKEHGKEAWLTEGGYDVFYGPAVGIYNQTILLPRLYLTARWAGSDKVFWYFDRDVPNFKQKFGSCGLIDLKGNVRPAGAALAMISRETATSRMLGRIDLEDTDTWAVVLEKCDGGYVVAAWTVEQKIPVPHQLKQMATKTYDMFGNEVPPESLGPEVHYFHVDSLPQSWMEMLETKLISTSVLPVIPGNSITVQLAAPDGAQFEWQDLPDGVKADNLTLHLDESVAPGKHPLLLKVGSSDYDKTFAITLKVRSLLKVSSEPYVPNATSTIEITSVSKNKEQWELHPSSGKVALQPDSFVLKPGEKRKIEVSVDGDLYEPVIIRAKSKNGHSQNIRLIPSAILAPRVEVSNAGLFPEVWPKGGLLDSEYFVCDQEAVADLDARIAWNAEGLFLAFRIPGSELNPGNPHNFWEGTNLEVFLGPDEGSESGWNSKTHHFFFVPYLESGQWKVSSGEWKRSNAIEKTIYNDTRSKTTISSSGDAVLLMVFIPSTAFNFENLSSGDRLSMAFTLRKVEGAMNRSTNFAWPREKESGILAGVHAWGAVKLVD